MKKKIIIYIKKILIQVFKTESKNKNLTNNKEEKWNYLLQLTSL